MLQYIKDWKIWLMCVAVLIVIETAGWPSEKPKSINWTIYAENVLQRDIHFQLEDSFVYPSLWNMGDKNPYARSNFKKQSKPEIGFKGLCFKWTKLNAIQSRYSFSKHWDLRISTKFNLKKFAPEHSFETVIGTASRLEFAAGAKFDEGWKLSPSAGITFRW